MAPRRRWPTYEERAEKAARGILDESLVMIPPYDLTDEEILAAFHPELREELRQLLQEARVEDSA